MNTKLTCITIFSVFICSCQEILFNNEMVTRDISLSAFHAVKISGIYDIILIQGDSEKLTVKGKNSVDEFNAEVINDTLIIEEIRGLSLNTERNTIELHFKNLSYIVSYDPINFSTIDTLKMPDLLFEALGEISEGKMLLSCTNLIVVNSANTLGYMRFIGNSESCTFFIRYGGAVFADSLFCKNAEVTSESVGDVYVNVSDKLNVSIWGAGNIYYSGNPSVTITEKRGSGNVLRKY